MLNIIVGLPTNAVIVFPFALTGVMLLGAAVAVFLVSLPYWGKLRGISIPHIRGQRLRMRRASI